VPRGCSLKKIRKIRNKSKISTKIQKIIKKSNNFWRNILSNSVFEYFFLIYEILVHQKKSPKSGKSAKIRKNPKNLKKIEDLNLQKSEKSEKIRKIQENIQKIP
jgi:hypothetical protein